MDATPTNSDGRLARRERTRQAIVAAHMALIEEGDVSPTGARIAARAGVSLRTFWLTFEDMDQLFDAVGSAVLLRMQDEHEPVPAGLALPARIEAYCRQRARLLELIGPFALASARRAPFSAVLRSYEREHVQRFAHEIVTLFAAELPEDEVARAPYVQAMTVATTWASWSVSRGPLGLDVAGATAVLARTVTDVLAAAARTRAA
jgi:TetR/AcrR family transcriptional regulator of autoinduction and epiphytic fitness